MNNNFINTKIIECLSELFPELKDKCISKVILTLSMDDYPKVDLTYYKIDLPQKKEEQNAT